jgi:hypothetical protein
MSNVEVTKPQVVRAFDTAIFVLHQVIASCPLLKEASDTPKAIYVVAKHLPVIEQIFTSARTQLNSGTDETEQIKDLYPVMKHIADESCGQVRSLENLFDTVTQNSEYGTKIERYALAVKGGDRKKVETIMLELLTNASFAAVEPLVSQEHIMILQGALEEVRRLPPSLDEDRDPSVVINNSGPGNQFYHGGKGNQNHCSGGFQVNGDNQNAQFTYAEKPKTDNM